MRAVSKACCLVLALTVPGSPAVAQDSRESVTITGQTDIDSMTADLDPAQDHFEGLTGDKIARDIDPVDHISAFREFARGLSGALGEDYD